MTKKKEIQVKTVGVKKQPREKRYDRINITSRIQDFTLDFKFCLCKGLATTENVSGKDFRLVKFFLLDCMSTMVQSLKNLPVEELKEIHIIFYTNGSILVSLNLYDVFFNQEKKSFTRFLSDWLNVNSPFRKKDMFLTKISVGLNDSSLHLLDSSGVHQNMLYVTSFITSRKSLLN